MKIKYGVKKTNTDYKSWKARDWVKIATPYDSVDRDHFIDYKLLPNTFYKISEITFDPAIEVYDENGNVKEDEGGIEITEEDYLLKLEIGEHKVTDPCFSARSFIKYED